MFSSTYARLESLGEGLYLRYLLDLQPNWQYHSTYNYLTLRNPFLSFLSIPLLLCPSCAVRRLSKQIEFLHYLPVYVTALIFFLFVNLILTPFTWIKQLTYRRSKRSFCRILLFFPFYSAFYLLPKHFFRYLIKLWDPRPKCLQKYFQK